jgi:16S rRNA processing protein RimM
VTDRSVTVSQTGAMVIGRIVGAFGVHGEAKVELLTDFPDRFNGLEHVLLGPDLKPATITAVRSHKGRLLIRLENVETPEAVEALRGAELAVPREEAVELPEGHYYLEDVIGCVVLTVSGAQVGKVMDVLRTGSNDVFVVGSGNDATLIPVIKDAIADLNLRERRIVVEGWVLEPQE